MEHTVKYGGPLLINHINTELQTKKKRLHKAQSQHCEDMNREPHMINYRITSVKATSELGVQK